MVVWVICGFMTLAAALSYGELSAMFPKAGGQYVYLKEAYGPMVSFTFGWTFLPLSRRLRLQLWGSFLQVYSLFVSGTR
ncbi:amino acid permease [Sphingobacterium sp. E70]|uniref:amino acid permease n=1 Tax=Sphingobacterium sp. E70 TaxID=2853439 RepID=UPI00211C3B46|nr:amino acid permease [Sphingobacterium sp. E70]